MWKKLALAILFCCLTQPLSLTGQGAPTQGTAMMSEAQALSMIRSKKASAPDVGLIVVQRIEPDSGTTAVAIEALAEARSKHLHLDEHGLFANLMRVGGYIVLEYSQRSERVIQLHFATQDEAGEPQFESWYLAPPDKTYDPKTESSWGSLNKDEALMLIRRNEEFSKAFFTSAPLRRLVPLRLRRLHKIKVHQSVLLVINPTQAVAHGLDIVFFRRESMVVLEGDASGLADVRKADRYGNRGVLAVSALRNSSAATPDDKANTSRAAGTSRLPLLPEREETWAICLLVNRDS